MKSRFIVIFTILSIMFCACRSSRPREIRPEDELTRDEYIQLVDMVRAVLVNAEQLKLSPEQEAFIKNEAPQFRFNYTGHKEGDFIMTWQPDKAFEVHVKGSGPFFDKSCRIRISVNRFE